MKIIFILATTVTIVVNMSITKSTVTTPNNKVQSVDISTGTIKNK